MNKSTSELLRRLLGRDRQALARAITLVESTNEAHRAQADILLDQVLLATPQSIIHPAGVGNEAQAPVPKKLPIRLGIAGPPGAGKSTLIEGLGKHLTGLGVRVAVLTIDPSSHLSGGSILGDKSRMTELSRDPLAYVRASPSRGVLGGLARYTLDVITLCEGAGYDVVVVETVGLGQSEVKVDDAVDVVCLVLPPAGGDELQGSKKGIVEVADAVVVNKADGDLLRAARATASSYRSALELCRPKLQGWKTPVLQVSALSGQGLDEVWKSVVSCRCVLETSGELLARRKRQAEFWMWEELRSQVMRVVERDPELRAMAAAETQALVSDLLAAPGHGSPPPPSSEGSQSVPVGSTPTAPTTPRAAASRLIAAVVERLKGKGDKLVTK